VRFAVRDFRFAINRPSACARPIENRAGFTLIELVTALLMVAMLAGSIYASLRVSFRAQAAAEAAVEPARTADVAMEMLREDIQNAMPPTSDLAIWFGGTDESDSRGSAADKLEFYSTAESRERPSGNGEIKKIELLVTAPANTTDHLLVRRVTRNLLAIQVPEPDEEVICRGVGGFNLRYFDGSEWLDTWDSTTAVIPLPLAVEVTLQLDRKTPDGQAKTHKYVRVYPLACAVVATEEEE
jgi:prepilin-type N-terminal cleavage/methylation domain-containing protein